MQEFFAALGVLKNPDQIKDVLQQSLTEEKKHMKYLIPFMCRLLNVKSASLMKCLIPAQELKNTSNWFFKEMIDTLCETDEAGPEDTLFLCQCLYESQCPVACRNLLDKLHYHLDLSGESLDPLHCCAVAYVAAQSTGRKISLNLEDVMVSEQGMRQLFGCLKNVQRRDPLQLWRVSLLSEGQMKHISLLGFDGNQMHLPVKGQSELFERAVRVMQRNPTKVDVCLHWERETPVCPSLCTSLLEALPHISSLSCCLNWELLHHLLQQSSAHTITMNLRRNRFLQESVTRLLPFLDRIVFKGLCPSFVLTAIREIYKAGAAPLVAGLLRSLDHEIDLTCRGMDSVDCAALLFTLRHSDGVKLNLLWTSVPAEEVESILFMLDKVSQISVDRKLLLRFVHSCAASHAQQGAAVHLLRAVCVCV